MARRVLLASMDVGGGHRALRESFRAALSAADPAGAELELIPFDSRDRRVDRFYSACVRHLPSLQGVLWELSERDWLARWAAVSCASLIGEVRAELERSRCELAIATHPLLSIAIARARIGLARPPVLASAVPDYGAPTTFFHPETEALRPDHLIVFSEESHGALRRLGVPDGRLHLSGFVTDDAFSHERRARTEPRSRRLEALAAELPELQRLLPGRPTALFLGGSGWTEKTWPVLERILARPALAETMNLAVVCGRDEIFAAKLRALAANRMGLAAFGFLPRSQLAALMASADVPVLGSLAPASLHELLEVGLGPLLVFRVIPGSEPPHLRFLERERLGVYEPDPERMVQLLERAVRRPPEGAWAELARTFPARSREVRALSAARAEQLFVAVRAMLGESPGELRARRASG